MKKKFAELQIELKKGLKKKAPKCITNYWFKKTMKK